MCLGSASKPPEGAEQQDVVEEGGPGLRELRGEQSSWTPQPLLLRVLEIFHNEKMENPRGKEGGPRVSGWPREDRGY